MKIFLFLFSLVAVTGVPAKASETFPTLVSQARSAPVYRLSMSDWILFPLSTQTFKAEVASHADLPMNTALDPDKKWSYTIQVQILNVSGTILETRDLAYESQSVLYHSQSLGTFSSSFYLEQDAQPTTPLVTLLNWKDRGRGAFVRVRLLKKDKNLQAVYCRVYEPSNLVLHLLSYWYHLNPADKLHVSEGNIYDPSLLSPEEKKNIVQNLWAPVGPRGIPNKTFQERLLYEVTPEGKELIKPIMPVGIYVDATHHVAVPISENNMPLRFHLAPPIATPRKGSFSLSLQWYGKGPAKPTEINLSTNSEGDVTHSFKKGIVFVSTPQPAVLQIFKNDGQEIFLKPASVKGYLIEKGKTVDYAIHHLKGRATPFRLDARKILLSPGENGAEGELFYDFLDDKGKVLKSSSYSPMMTPSLYNRVTQDPTMNLSEADNLYFILPEKVKRVRLSANTSFFVTAYNRPEDLKRQYQIPEDYYLYESPEESLRRSWFYLSPLNTSLLSQEGRELLFSIQPQPVETDERILLGTYEWNQLIPKEEWLFLYGLMPRSLELPQNPQAQQVTYSPLPTAGKREISFHGVMGMREIRPALLYFKPKELPEPLVIKIDGKDVIKENILGTQGEIQLPPLSVGKHILTIDGPPTAKFFMSQLLRETESYLKRRLILLKKGKTEFSYIKKQSTEEETLALYLIGPPQTRIPLSLKIKGPSPKEEIPLSDYTIREREYDVLFSGDPVFFLSPKKDDYLSSEPIFIKLGNDLPVGTYAITLETPNDTYALLSQLIPGHHNKRTLSIEIIK